MKSPGTLILLVVAAVMVTACTDSAETTTTAAATTGTAVTETTAVAETTTTAAATTSAAVTETTAVIDAAETQPPTDPGGATTGTDDGHVVVAFAGLSIGGCFNALQVDVMQTGFDSEVDSVSCVWAHEAEVYASYGFDDLAEFPDTGVARDPAAKHCDDAFSDYVGIPVGFSSLSAWPVLPTEPDWEEGIRHAVCVLIDSNGDNLRGSARQQGW